MTPLPRPEYIRIPLKFLSPKIITQHSLQPFVHNNSILFEVITKSMYDLSHAGKIAQDVLIGRLATHGYLQTRTTCLFRHVTTNGVAFALVLVDDFAAKFKDLVSADHQIACLELFYKLTIKKNATKYRGLTIEVDKAVHEVRISALGVIAKALKQFAPNFTAVARSPAVYQPPRFAKEAQIPAPPHTSPLLTSGKHHSQQQIGGVL